jgi:hypothetical protein
MATLLPDQAAESRRLQDAPAAPRAGSAPRIGADRVAADSAARAQGRPPELERSGKGGAHLAAQLHAVEKHLRKNPIAGVGATFAQARVRAGIACRAARLPRTPSRCARPGRRGGRPARWLSADYLMWSALCFTCAPCARVPRPAAGCQVRRLRLRVPGRSEQVHPGTRGPCTGRYHTAGGAAAAQTLSSTAATKRAASQAGEKQARRLALYIYWNVKASYERRAPMFPTLAACLCLCWSVIGSSAHAAPTLTLPYIPYLHNLPYLRSTSVSARLCVTGCSFNTR